MKRKFLITLLSLISVLCLSFGLTACGDTTTPNNQSGTHSHSYVQKHDDTEHWLQCDVSGCTEKTKDRALHNTNGDNGACSVCGYKASPTHSHNWSPDWQTDEASHWHDCTTEGCTVTDNTQKDGYGEHDFTSGTCICGKQCPHDWQKTSIKAATCTEEGLDLYECNYCGKTEEKIVSALDHNIEWNHDYSHHEGHCINGDCNLIVEKHFHTWTPDNTCADCGYELPYTRNLDYTLSENSKEYSVSVPKALTLEDYREQNSIVFPIFHNGLPVTTISEREFGDNKFPDNISSVYIPETIKTIGRRAFCYFSGLTKIVLGGEPKIAEYAFSYTGYYNDDNNWTNGILYLDNYLLCATDNITEADIRQGTKIICEGALYNKRNLKSVKIPASVLEIDDSAFYMTALTDVFYNGTIEQWCTIDFSPSAYVFYYSNTSSDARYCNNFYINDKLVTNLVIPGTVKKIPASAFEGYLGLTSVTIQEGVIEICDSAFYCPALKKVSIPNSLEKLGDNALFTSSTIVDQKFEYTKSNNGYYIGNSSNPYLVLILASAGSSQNPAKYFTVNSRTKFIHSATSANAVNKIVSVTIPEGIVSIGANAFYSQEISNINLPKSIKRIGATAFAGNPFTSVTIPEGVEEIGSLAFGLVKNVYYKGTLEQWYNVPIGGHISRWMLGGFYNGNYDIALNYNLYIEDTLLVSVNIPATVKAIGVTFSGCSSLSRMTVDENNESYASQDGILYNKAKTQFIYIPKAIKGAVTIPDSVTSISNGAFSGCSSLTSVTLPNGLKSIGHYAFQDCNSLTSITIPNSVTSIGDSAFSGCSNLTSITIPNSVTSIGGNAFDGCNKLRYNEYGNAYYLGNDTNPYAWLIKAKNTYITSCTVHENTTAITGGAFYDCSKLTSITIPNGLTSIGRYAFRFCSLTKISFNGTKAQWKAIEKDSYWKDDAGNFTVICTDGKLDKWDDEIT